MLPFLDLKAINQQYKQELMQVFERVFDSGWYIMGKELSSFEQYFAQLILFNKGHCQLIVRQVQAVFQQRIRFSN